MAGVWFEFNCRICGELCHPNTPWAMFGPFYLHLNEYAGWKVPPSHINVPEWKEYDHRAKFPKRKKADVDG